MLETPRSVRWRWSFTLVEVLLALVLAVVVLSAAGPLAVSALQMRQALDHAARPIRRESMVLGKLEEDLRSGPLRRTSQACAIRLIGQPLPTLEVEGLVAVPGESPSLHVVRLPATVRYRLARGHSSAKDFELLREVQDRTDPAQRWRCESLSSGVAGFDVEVLAKGAWQRSFPAKDRSWEAAAVRIRLTWSDGGSASRIVVLLP
jgi:type II secretory pathway component PulJ